MFDLRDTAYRHKAQDDSGEGTPAVLPEDRVDQVRLSIGPSGSPHLGLPVAEKFALYIVGLVFGARLRQLFQFDLFLAVTNEEAPYPPAKQSNVTIT